MVKGLARRWMVLGLWGGSALVAGLGVACTSAAVDPVGPGGPKTCSAVGEPTIVPLDAEGRSSTVVLGRVDKGPLKGKTLAFVADADSQSIVTLNVDDKKQIASTPVGAEPAQLVLLADGRVLATLRSSSQLAVLHTRQDGSMTVGCSVTTKIDPVGVTMAGEDVLVMTGWGNAVEIFGKADLARRASIDVAREPRQAVVTDDGKNAFVSHAIGGKVTVLSLADRKVEAVIDITTDPNAAVGEDGDTPRDLSSKLAKAVASKASKKIEPGKNFARIGSQGFSITKTRKPKGRILLPQTLVDPGDKDVRSRGYGSDVSPAFGDVGVIDVGERELAGISSRMDGNSLFAMEEGRRFAFGVDGGLAPCLLPRAAAIDEATSTLLVACMGVDAVIGYDAASAAPNAVEKVRWNVPSGPTGIALDPSKRRAVVFSQFERSLKLLSLDEIGKLEVPTVDARENRIPLAPLKTALPLSLVLGRQIFHSTDDARISGTSVGCASCHVDGRDDALVWSSPDGPRRTRSLAAGLNEAPFGWDGESKEVGEAIEREFRRLHGQGLRNVQLQALLAYLATLKSPAPWAPGADAALVAKGKEVFSSEAARCGTCHLGGGSDKKAYDVGSKTSYDRRPAFDTPSLFGLAARAPFFHDGRFATIDELLEVPHVKRDDKPPSLDAEQRKALKAYLLSL